MTPQQFVDSLNYTEMPRLGYELVESESGSYWCWPIYDWSQRAIGKDGKNQDFKGKDFIAAQRQRLGTQEYEPELIPADEQTRNTGIAEKRPDQWTNPRS